MIFVIGDIVKLSDGMYDQVIGFDDSYRSLPITRKRGHHCNNGPISIIGHKWSKYDRNDGVIVTLYSEDQ